MNIIFTRPLIDAEDIMMTFFSSGHKVIHVPTLSIASANMKPINVNDYDGLIFGYSNYPLAAIYPNQFGWLELNGKEIVEVGLKRGWNKCFNNPIVTGHFYFKSSVEIFNLLSAYLSNIEYNVSERSIDSFCKYMIENGKKIGLISCKDFLCLGTPEESRTYEYWMNANKVKPLKK